MPETERETAMGHDRTHRRHAPRTAAEEIRQEVEDAGTKVRDDDSGDREAADALRPGERPQKSVQRPDERRR
ncbi:hypothetical protein HW130_13255 [Streptomyces sp. PKU-EA00015]|uniref:hypothetical protein n=1 Tax=Streptomyces sp. PKU-EA00015 TaxID=2748326 RepID=UPI0015A1B09C|nr:hypothetical protein [Streptomyces sp. PKU-EA00015]NWF27230.1 hypothetical protein [Streptomyces sp. PKU-EA00015]